MPDVISNVAFRSDGAPIGAAVGVYPIYPSGIVFVGNARVRYSVRYVPAVLTVNAGNIAFVRAQRFSTLGSTGIQTLSIIQPSSQHLLIAIVSRKYGGASFAGPGHTGGLGVAAVTNGAGDAFSRVGGANYQSLYSWSNGVEDEGYTLSMWYRIASAGSDDATVKVTYIDGADDPVNEQSELLVMEYVGAAVGSPVSDFVKLEASDPASPLGTANIAFSDLDLNNTSGQLVVAAFGSFGGLAGVDFNPSYTPRGGDTLNGQLRVEDKSGLSGLGPVNPSLPGLGGTATFAGGMAIALTR